MAAVLQAGTTLESQIAELRGTSRPWRTARNVGLILIVLGMTAPGAIMPLLGTLLAPLYGLTLLGGIGLVIVYGLRLDGVNRQIRIIKLGIDGEHRTRAIFSGLTDRYTVFPDVCIEVDGRQSQIDHLVVGPTGVFVVETKHWTGCIEGNARDHQITQHKVGRKGGRYSRHLYNPVRQVGTHVYRVAQLLKQHGLRTWVTGVVYFSHPAVSLDLDGGAVPVFCSNHDGASRLIAFIEGASATISPAEQTTIVNLIRSAAGLPLGPAPLADAPKSGVRTETAQPTRRFVAPPVRRQDDALAKAPDQRVPTLNAADVGVGRAGLPPQSSIVQEQDSVRQRRLATERFDALAEHMRTEAYLDMVQEQGARQGEQMMEPYQHWGSDAAIDHDVHEIPNGLGDATDLHSDGLGGI